MSKNSETKPANIKEVRDFFGMDTTSFTPQWKELSDEEKDWFKTEVGKAIGKR